MVYEMWNKTPFQTTKSTKDNNTSVHFCFWTSFEEYNTSATCKYNEQFFKKIEVFCSQNVQTLAVPGKKLLTQTSL